MIPARPGMKPGRRCSSRGRLRQPDDYSVIGWGQPPGSPEDQPRAPASPTSKSVCVARDSSAFSTLHPAGARRNRRTGAIATHHRRLAGIAPLPARRHQGTLRVSSTPIRDRLCQVRNSPLEGGLGIDCHIGAAHDGSRCARTQFSMIARDERMSRRGSKCVVRNLPIHPILLTKISMQGEFLEREHARVRAEVLQPARKKDV